MPPRIMHTGYVCLSYLPGRGLSRLRRSPQNGFGRLPSETFLWCSPLIFIPLSVFGRNT